MPSSAPDPALGADTTGIAGSDVVGNEGAFGGSTPRSQNFPSTDEVSFGFSTLLYEGSILVRGVSTGVYSWTCLV